jgi:cysteinyl-tRNA synthetase
MHVGSLQVNGEKMSKSLKNFITIKQALEIYPKELIRFFMFSTHYRKPINWSEEVIQSSKNALIKIYKSLQKGMEQAGNTPKKLQIAELKDYPNATEFVLAMKDDFNTPKAISILHSISSKLQKQEDKKERPKLVQELIFCLDMLGAYTNDISIITGNKSNKKEVDTKKIEEQIAKRQEAKVNKDYALADKIREDLLKDGIELQDKPNGVVEWVKK